MVWLHIIWLLGAALESSSAATTSPPSGTAKSFCQAAFELIADGHLAQPKDNDGTTPESVRERIGHRLETLLETLTHDEASIRETTGEGDLPPAVRELRDGWSVLYESGAAHRDPGRPSPHHFPDLHQRLNTLISALKNEKNPRNLFFSTFEEEEIRKLLEPSEPNQQKKTNFFCKFPGRSALAMGTLVGGYYFFQKSPAEIKFQEIINQAQSRVVGSRERHFELIHHLLNNQEIAIHNFNKERFLREHIQSLDEAAQQGIVPLRFGARPHNYQSAFADPGSSTALHLRLMHLATANPGWLTQNNLQRDSNPESTSSRTRVRFTTEELETAHQLQSSVYDWVWPSIRRYLSGPFTSGLTLLGAVLLCDQAGGTLISPPRPRFSTSELQPILGAYQRERGWNENQNPEGFSTQIVWVGGSLQGFHNDLFLFIDRRNYNSRYYLMGISTQAPLNSSPPPQANSQPTAAVPISKQLNSMKELLINLRFTSSNPASLEIFRINQVFRRAKKVINSENIEIFLGAIERVRGPNDLQILEDLISELEEKK